MWCRALPKTGENTFDMTRVPGTLRVPMTKKKSGTRRLPQPFLRAVLIIVSVCGALLALLFAALVFSPNVRVVAVQTTLSAMGADIPEDAFGQTNILLLGVGDQNHDGADLTDTMMIASIDPLETRSVVLLSLPRDLLLEDTSKMASGRINAVYANEKYRLMHRENMTEADASQQSMNTLAERLGEKTGMDIHGVLKADFTAFTNIVDALGGVDVDVPERIVDYSYPISERAVGIFEIDAGPQRLDGETALRYARSRHSTSDFDRSARQQQLISALGERFRSLGKVSQANFLLSLDEQLKGHVETTMPQEQLLGLAQIGTELSLDRVIAMQLNFNVGSDASDAEAGGFVFPAPPEVFSGASVLLPIPSPAGTYDWGHIRTFLHILTSYRPLFLEERQIAIHDFGAAFPHASRLRNELRRYGWDVLPMEAEEIPEEELPEESMVFYREHDDADAAKFLGNLLALPVAKAANEGAFGSGDILLMLGKGFEYAPFRTLSGGVLEVR